MGALAGINLSPEVTAAGLTRSSRAGLTRSSGVESNVESGPAGSILIVVSGVRAGALACYRLVFMDSKLLGAV